jgi:aromatic-L-amino-acid decarboxylase
VLPAEAPQDPEDWDAIMADVETKIMPGVSWTHQKYFSVPIVKRI